MPTTSTLRGSDAEETGGLDVVDVKRFLIGINALLTNANRLPTSYGDARIRLPIINILALQQRNNIIT